MIWGWIVYLFPDVFTMLRLVNSFLIWLLKLAYLITVSLEEVGKCPCSFFHSLCWLLDGLSSLRGKNEISIPGFPSAALFPHLLIHQLRPKKKKRVPCQKKKRGCFSSCHNCNGSYTFPMPRVNCSHCSKQDLFLLNHFSELHPSDSSYKSFSNGKCVIILISLDVLYLLFLDERKIWITT